MPSDHKIYCLLSKCCIISVLIAPYLNCMNCQLSPYSTDYFTELETTIRRTHKELQHQDSLVKERIRKYEGCLAEYEKYIKKESQLVKRNQQHCALRNKFYLEQVKNAWKNSISNRQLILRSLARTNVIKKDADDWLAKMDGDNLHNRSVDHSEDSLNGSQLVHKYNQILQQYMR